MQSLWVISVVLVVLVGVPLSYAIPSFTKRIYTATTDESAPKDTKLTQVTFTPDDGSLSFSISSDSLKVDTAGNVILMGELDYETTSQISAKITATDLDSNTASASFVLTITDVNDNSPEFVEDYTVTVTPVENKLAVASFTPLTISAVDFDSVDAVVSYSITGGSQEASLFAIDKTTGVLTLRSEVDTTGMDKIIIEVTASDSDERPQTTATDVTIVIKAPVGNYKCGVNWIVNRGNGKCYKLVRGGKTWKGAQKTCRLYGNKVGLTPGNLVTITDSDTQDWIVNTLANKRRIWIGLNDQETDGSFQWADKTPYQKADYGNWATFNGNEQPSASSKTNCVAVDGMRRKIEGKWDDIDCNTKVWSVCEFPAIALPDKK